ncbi:MAG: hypothetical protein K2W78_04150 [Xanthobacteraceae bacterium]|nr:hypothetical protein [Xanthobacteraceae bacterium]
MVPSSRLPVLKRILPVAGAIVALGLSPLGAKAQTVASTCDDADIAVLSSPASPWKGAPLRVVVTSEKPLDGGLSLIGPDGEVAATSHTTQGGPPYFWFAEVKSPGAGTWHASLTRSRAAAGCTTMTRDIAVRDIEPPRPTSVAGSVWPVRRAWDRKTEDLYSAWIEKLFDAPLDSPPSWPALHVILRDPQRNLLFNYLGLREDEMNVVLKPDCADMPYFLRAYFAFKLGLPFGYSKCTRGGGGAAPRCPQWFNIENPDTTARVPKAQQIESSNGQLPVTPVSVEPAPKRLGLAASFAQYIPIIGDAVHSGSGRTLATDSNADYYPVPLTQDALRPGTIYADPYGHVLMLTKRVAQTGTSAGVFLAADAQPDGTVAIKRFWRGNFLFAQDPALGGPGFKHFRPIVRDSGGALRRLTNDEIAKNPQYANYSPEQSKLSVEAFYDRMDDVMSPEPLDPSSAMKEVITALDEQVQARVTSVENGRKFLNSGKGEAAMPKGPAIFETTGAWEDFATPSRDLRLLIAIDVVRGFPDRVARRSDRYAMPATRSTADVKADLQNELASELATRKITYTRSDGSPWTVPLKDIVDRVSALEMAYNVNDCVELRWGAAEKSDEAATCKKHAPAAQRADMLKYREWFHDRRRPPRA